jgi:hypothetical protein
VKKEEERISSYNFKGANTLKRKWMDIFLRLYFKTGQDCWKHKATLKGIPSFACLMLLVDMFKRAIISVSVRLKSYFEIGWYQIWYQIGYKSSYGLQRCLIVERVDCAILATVCSGILLLSVLIVLLSCWTRSRNLNMK